MKKIYFKYFLYGNGWHNLPYTYYKGRCYKYLFLNMWIKCKDNKQNIKDYEELVSGGYIK